jgi:RNA polymerase sigma-70 factor (ECF subfamily)
MKERDVNGDRAMDEQSLIQAVQEGRVDAYGQLMDLHVRRLRAVIALNAPVAHLIDEIAHETFVFAFNHIQEFQRGTSFFAWIKSIAWNLLRAEIQRFSREQANQSKYAERRVVEATPFKPVELAAKELDKLETCLEKVPPRLKQLVEMRYRLSFSTQEIAEKAGQSNAWVRTTLCRLRKQLRDCVNDKLAVEKA